MQVRYTSQKKHFWKIRIFFKSIAAIVHFQSYTRRSIYAFPQLLDNFDFLGGFLWQLVYPVLGQTLQCCTRNHFELNPNRSLKVVLHRLVLLKQDAELGAVGYSFQDKCQVRCAPNDLLMSSFIWLNVPQTSISIQLFPLLITSWYSSESIGNSTALWPGGLWMFCSTVLIAMKLWLAGQKHLTI